MGFLRAFKIILASILVEIIIMVAINAKFTESASDSILTTCPRRRPPQNLEQCITRILLVNGPQYETSSNDLRLLHSLQHDRAYAIDHATFLDPRLPSD